MELTSRVATTESDRFAEAWKSPKPWQGGLIWGPAGVGKTHEAIRRLASVPDPPLRMAMASYGRGGAQNRKGRVCTAMRYIELARKYEMDTLDEGAPNWNERREFSEAQDCVALVLDDVGVRRATDFGLDALQWLVDYRWKNSLETLATSNLSPGELAQRLDDRIVSRLCGFGKVEHMDGPDRRLQGA